MSFGTMISALARDAKERLRAPPPRAQLPPEPLK